MRIDGVGGGRSLLTFQIVKYAGGQSQTQLSGRVVGDGQLQDGAVGPGRVGGHGRAGHRSHKSVQRIFVENLLVERQRKERTCSQLDGIKQRHARHSFGQEATDRTWGNNGRSDGTNRHIGANQRTAGPSCCKSAASPA